MATRLQRKHDKDSMKQAGKYILLTLIGVFILLKFGLPSLIKLAGFISDLGSSNDPIERQDSLAPAQPVLFALPEATSSARITLSGYTEAGAKVRLFRDGIILEETISNDEGNFEYKDISLKDGENNFYTQAQDSAGNESEPSHNYSIVFDDEKPELTVDEPKSGQKFFDADSPITVMGKTETGSQLMLNGKFIMVNSEGGFNSKWPLSPGDNQLDFVSRDGAGNETQLNFVVNYTP